MAGYVPHQGGHIEDVALPHAAGAEHIPQLGANQLIHICGGDAPALMVPERPGAAQKSRPPLRSRPAKALRQRDGPKRSTSERGQRFSLSALPAVFRPQQYSAANQLPQAGEAPPLGQTPAVVTQAEPPAAQPKPGAHDALYAAYGEHTAAWQRRGSQPLFSERPILQRSHRPDCPPTSQGAASSGQGNRASICAAPFS